MRVAARPRSRAASAAARPTARAVRPARAIPRRTGWRPAPSARSSCPRSRIGSQSPGSAMPSSKAPDAAGLVGRRPAGGADEAELLVLGADPVLGPRLAPGRDVVSQLLTDAIGVSSVSPGLDIVGPVNVRAATKGRALARQAGTPPEGAGLACTGASAYAGGMQGCTDIANDRLGGPAARRASRAYAVLARLDRPIGAWLLFLPGLWSILLARIDAAGTLRLIAAVRASAASSCAAPAASSTTCGTATWTGASPAPPAGRWPAARCGCARRRRSCVLLLVIGLGILLQLEPLAQALGRRCRWCWWRSTRWPSGSPGGRRRCSGLTFSWGAPMGYAAATGRLDAGGARALCGGVRLDPRLRHDLRAPGSRGRRADRRAQHGPAVCRPYAARSWPPATARLSCCWRSPGWLAGLGPGFFARAAAAGSAARAGRSRRSTSTTRRVACAASS